jgi:hypothetical protein
MKLFPLQFKVPSPIWCSCRPLTCLMLDDATLKLLLFLKIDAWLVF